MLRVICVTIKQSYNRVRVVSDSGSTSGLARLCRSQKDADALTYHWLLVKWAFELVTWVTATELKPGMRSRGDSPAVPLS